MGADAERPDRDRDEERAAPQGRRVRRRASLPAPEGSDPAPHDPPVERRREEENDERLLKDVPPHWR